MSKTSPRRALMRPVQLLGLAFAAAVFTFVVTILSMGLFQNIPAASKEQALVVASILAGSVFVVTLVVIALLLLAVDPADVTKTVDRPVLLPKDEPDAGEPGRDDAPGEPRR